MNQLSPLISVIIPCYNQGRYLDIALNSIFEQDYTNFECIIVNDGSSDNTSEVAQKWIKKDERYKYFEQINRGLSSARNRGLLESKGYYIQFLDCDDFIHSKKISKSIRIFDNEKSCSAVISNFEMINDQTNDQLEPYCDLNQVNFDFNTILHDWQNSFSIPIHCAIFKRDSIIDILFDTELRAHEDWIFWLNFFYLKNEVHYLNESLAFYRLNIKGLSKMDNRDNYLLALEKIKLILDPEEYLTYLKKCISRQYSELSQLKFRLNQLKRSNTYIIGLFFKKLFGYFGLMRISRPMFLILKKFRK